jgi:hypothetical protein
MEKDIRLMNEVIRIVNGALRLDTNKVRNYTSHLADKLDAAGEQSTADRLRKVLAETDSQLRPADVRFQKSLPVDADSRFPLLEHVAIKQLNEPPVHLDDSQWAVVNEFMSVAGSQSATDNDTLTGALSLLMYGAPGTGKSRLARHIAGELGLELYVARLDGLISSFLGSTSKNMRALFDFAAGTPCVLFLDEFDAIAKLRGDTQELGELKRVVNSFLQNLDTLGRESIIVAATNHEGLLDAAVWRRFTYRLSLQLPNTGQRLCMWRDFLSPVAFPKAQMSALVDLSEGLSGSDIQEISTRVKRRQTALDSPVSLHDLFPILRNLGIGGQESSSFISTLTQVDDVVLVRALRLRNPKLYSYALLSKLLNVSKAKAHRLATQEVKPDG